MTLAVTGATGRVGGRVARLLAETGVEQRLVVRDPSRAPRLEGATVAVATYGDGDASRKALEGVDTLFMVSAAEDKERRDQHYTFVDAAAAAGVRHIVYTSFFKAAPDCTFTLGRDHYATEERILASGMTSTFLRDNLYADFLRLFADDRGVIRGPADAGRLAAVAIRDVADAGVAVLSDPAAHQDAVYDLTGPADLSLAEAAQILTERLGSPYSFQDETVEEAYASRARYGAERWQLDAWVSTYTAIAKGELEGVTDHVERLTGHPATPLAELLASA